MPTSQQSSSKTERSTLLEFTAGDRTISFIVPDNTTTIKVVILDNVHYEDLQIELDSAQADLLATVLGELFR